MQKFVENIRNRHDSIYKVLLFLGTIAFIVFLLPREVSFKYEFQKNKAWQYGDLFAPYSIPLIKNLDDLRLESKQVESKKKLYFKYNEDVYDQKIVQFELELMEAIQEKHGKEMEDGLPADEMKKGYMDVAEPVIRGIYKKGLADAQGELGNLNDSASFYVVKNNVAGAYTKDDVFTLKSAVEFAEHNLRKEYDYKEVILKVLEQVLRKDAANVVYDARKTQLVLNAELAKLETDAGSWEQGRLIIRRGENIDQEKLEILNSFKNKYESQILEKNKRLVVIFAQLILVTAALGCFFLFLYYFRKEIFFNNRHLVFLLMLLNIFALATVIALKVSWLKVYVVPFCLIPVIVRSFFDTRIAFFTHLVALMIVGFMVADSFSFVFYQFVAGIIAIFGFANFRRRSQLLVTSGMVFAAYSITFFALTLLQEGDFSRIMWRDFMWFGISSMLIMFAYPMIFAFEKMFGFVSDMTLLELSDTNNTLLRELSLKAPGTFQHSLQVANLAEAAIYQVGGNALLIRTAALYHDIGKMERPMYFIENQVTGVNPHHELSSEESARIIIEHVIHGIEIAKKHRLPEQVIDFIRTHHGTAKAEYFYRKAKEDFPEESPEVDRYTYPGPIPFSKETAVLMMADSVEAASRSLKEVNSEKIEQLVEKIIHKQMEEGQFINADITLKEISQIKKILKKMLMNIYHVRIEYPNA